MKMCRINENYLSVGSFNSGLHSIINVDKKIYCNKQTNKNCLLTLK